MDLNLMKTLKSIEKLISEADFINIEKIKKAYSQTLKLRSQLISVIYDIEEYMAFGVVANWGEEGKTVIKVCDFEEVSTKKQ